MYHENKQTYQIKSLLNKLHIEDTWLTGIRLELVGIDNQFTYLHLSLSIAVGKNECIKVFADVLIPESLHVGVDGGGEGGGESQGVGVHEALPVPVEDQSEKSIKRIDQSENSIKTIDQSEESIKSID